MSERTTVRMYNGASASVDGQFARLVDAKGHLINLPPGQRIDVEADTLRMIFPRHGDYAFEFYMLIDLDANVDDLIAAAGRIMAMYPTNFSCPADGAILQDIGRGGENGGAAFAYWIVSH